MGIDIAAEDFAGVLHPDRSGGENNGDKRDNGQTADDRREDVEEGERQHGAGVFQIGEHVDEHERADHDDAGNDEVGNDAADGAVTRGLGVLCCECVVDIGNVGAGGEAVLHDGKQRCGDGNAGEEVFKAGRQDLNVRDRLRSAARGNAREDGKADNEHDGKNEEVECARIGRGIKASFEHGEDHDDAGNRDKDLVVQIDTCDGEYDLEHVAETDELRGQSRNGEHEAGERRREAGRLAAGLAENINDTGSTRGPETLCHENEHEPAYVPADNLPVAADALGIDIAGQTDCAAGANRRAGQRANHDDDAETAAGGNVVLGVLHFLGSEPADNNKSYYVKRDHHIVPEV